MTRRINVGGSSVPELKGSLITSTSNRRRRPDASASRPGSTWAMRCAISGRCIGVCQQSYDKDVLGGLVLLTAHEWTHLVGTARHHECPQTPRGNVAAA